MLPPTIAAALITARQADRHAAAERARRDRRMLLDELQPTRRKGRIRKAARVARAAAEPT